MCFITALDIDSTPIFGDSILTYCLSLLSCKPRVKENGPVTFPRKSFVHLKAFKSFPSVLGPAAEQGHYHKHLIRRHTFSGIPVTLF